MNSVSDETTISKKTKLDINTVLTDLAEFVNLFGYKFLKENRITILVSVIVTLDSFVVGVFGNFPSLEMSAGYYSALFAEIFWYFNLQQGLDMVDEMKNMYSTIERITSEKDKARLNATAAGCAKWMAAFKVYSVLVAILLCFMPWVIFRPVCKMWPEGPEGKVFALITQSIISFYGGIAGVRLLIWILSIYSILGSLFEAMGTPMETFKGAAFLEVVKIHQTLTVLARRVDNLHARWIVNNLEFMMIMPLIAIYEIGTGRGVGVSLICIPLLIVAFIPWCMEGQKLEDASCAVGFHAYCGPWLEEDWRIRKLRIAVMERSFKPCRFTVYGLGNLNHQSCLAVFKTWFSYLQLVFKL